MFKQIDDLLGATDLRELHAIADQARFVDGRVSNPHNKAKQNLQLHEPAHRQRSAKIMADALFGHPEFQNFAFPKTVAPPLITAYRPGMRYGLHSDASFIQLGERALRSDLSCTIFLSDPGSYEGGGLRIALGSADILIRPAAGTAILYPSNTLHEVVPVTSGERRVGITFIESRIADPTLREWLYELNEVAALEGNGMSHENFTRLQRVQSNLMRLWSDPD